VGLSVALGAAVAVDAEPTGPVAVGALAAVLLVSLALVTGRSAPIPCALVLLGALYAIPAGERAVWAPLYGAGLLLCAELAYWSRESRVVQPVYGDVVGPRLLAVLAVVAASVPAGALALVAADTGPGRSPATTTAAALAITACAGLLTLMARSPAPRPGR
jgi:hypothetical protein